MITLNSLENKIKKSVFQVITSVNYYVYFTQWMC